MSGSTAENAHEADAGGSLAHRRRLQFRLSSLLILPVIVALGALLIPRPAPRTIAQLWDHEHDWVRSPLKEPFIPAEGESVRAGDPLLKIAQISQYDTGFVWIVQADGMIGDIWYASVDAGGNDKLGFADPDGLATLPASLQRLPPSNVTGTQRGILVIAFPQGDKWIFRRYRHDLVPPEVNALARSLGLRSSLNSKRIVQWNEPP